jgi:hypothetical protein
MTVYKVEIDKSVLEDVDEIKRFLKAKMITR